MAIEIRVYMRQVDQENVATIAREEAALVACTTAYLSQGQIMSCAWAASVLCDLYVGQRRV